MGGTISVKSSAGVTIVLDAMGYFVTSSTGGAGFQPIAPQRVYDSRGALYGGVPVTDVDIRVSDGAGVGAVLVNVIAFQPAGAALVDVYPSGEVHEFDTLLVGGSGHLATSSLAFVRPSGDGRIHVNVSPVVHILLWIWWGILVLLTRLVCRRGIRSRTVRLRLVPRSGSRILPVVTLRARCRLRRSLQPRTRPSRQMMATRMRACFCVADGDWFVLSKHQSLRSE